MDVLDALVEYEEPCDEKKTENVKKSTGKVKGQFRNWPFTNYKLDFDYKQLIKDNKDIIRYILVGVETCPKTQNVHHQGFIQFYNKKRFGGVKKLFHKKIHIENMKGTVNENVIYCKKEGQTLIEWGVPKSQGQRSDLENVQKILRDGGTLDDVMEDHFALYCKYRNGIRDYAASTMKRNSTAFRELEVTYRFGDTNTNKTRTAMEEYPDAFKIHASDLKWWDGYNGESVVIIDEYDSDIKLTKLLGILDGYRLRLPIKGGFTYAAWNKVIITSNIPPDHLHPNAKYQHHCALRRRLHKVYWHRRLETNEIDISEYEMPYASK